MRVLLSLQLLFFFFAGTQIAFHQIKQQQAIYAAYLVSLPIRSLAEQNI